MNDSDYIYNLFFPLTQRLLSASNLGPIDCDFSKIKLYQHLESFVLKLIANNIDPRNLYYLFQNLSHHYEAELSAFKLDLLQLITNAFLSERNKNYFIFFANEDFYVRTDLLPILYQKSIQFSNIKIIELAYFLFKNINEPIAEVIYYCIMYQATRFNSIFEMLDISIKTKLFIVVLNKLNYTSIMSIDFHITSDLAYKNYIEDILIDGHPLMDSFIGLPSNMWYRYYHFTKIMFINKDKLQFSFKEMIDKAVSAKDYSQLLFLATGANKREILKLLINNNQHDLVNQFFNEFKSDPEIKVLVPFL